MKKLKNLKILMIILIFMTTSCLTTTINIEGYKEIKPEKKTIVEDLLKQINEMSIYIDNLTYQILKADKKRIIVQDLRED